MTSTEVKPSPLAVTMEESTISSVYGDPEREKVKVMELMSRDKSRECFLGTSDFHASEEYFDGVDSGSGGSEVDFVQTTSFVLDLHRNWHAVVHDGHLQFTFARPSRVHYNQDSSYNRP